MHFHFEFFSTAADKNLFMREFLSYPEKLFANSPGVKKIPFEVEALYFKMHPLKHDFFLLRDKGEIVLRSMICKTPHEGIMYFGLFDFDYTREDVSVILCDFKEILKEWGESVGAASVLGPVNFSTWLPYRLFSFSDGEERLSFEPDRPMAYVDLLKKNGLTTNQLFSSRGYDNISSLVQATKSDFEKASGLGYKFEFLNSSLSEDDLKDLHRLSLDIFRDNYLATPIDFMTFKILYAEAAGKEDYSNSLFILSPEGKRIGFFFTFFEGDYCVAKTIGIEKRHRGSGISNGSFYLALKRAEQRGFHKMIAAMVKEGAQSESYGRKMPLLWTHLYEMMELKLRT